MNSVWIHNRPHTDPKKCLLFMCLSCGKIFYENKYGDFAMGRGSCPRCGIKIDKVYISNCPYKDKNLTIEEFSKVCPLGGIDNRSFHIIKGKTS